MPLVPTHTRNIVAILLYMYVCMYVPELIILSLFRSSARQTEQNERPESNLVEKRTIQVEPSFYYIKSDKDKSLIKNSLSLITTNLRWNVRLLNGILQVAHQHEIPRLVPVTVNSAEIDVA